MLLSKSTLDKLQEKEKETKIDRVKLYVTNQKEYIDHYTSPNRLSSSTSSCYNDDNEDAFTSSISEILLRKKQEQDNNQKKKSIIEIDPIKPLPKSKSNGFHLLEVTILQ